MDQKILITEDDTIQREIISDILLQSGYTIVAAESAERALTILQEEACDVLLTDMRMPGMDGLELQAALLRIETSLPIIFVTGHGDVPMSVRAMKAGAVDFLLKPFDREELLAAIRQAVEKDRAQRLEGNRLAELRARFQTLTPREREVLTCVVSGALNKQIAYQLGVQEGTIKVHRRQVMEKMRAASLAQLVRMAEQLGIEVEQG